MSVQVTDVRPLLSVGDVARLLGVSRKTVYRLVDEGALPWLRVRSVYRFEPAAVDAYIKASRGEMTNP